MISFVPDAVFQFLSVDGAPQHRLASQWRALRASIAVTIALVLGSGCQTTPPAAASAQESTESLLRSWTGAQTLAPDATLEEVALLLCSRETDAIIDPDVRAATAFKDAQAAAVLAIGRSVDEVKAIYLAEAPGILAPVFGTHVGAVLAKTPDGRQCFATVVARRHATVVSTNRTDDDQRLLFVADLHAARTDPVLFVARPDGSVARFSLEPYAVGEGSASKLRVEQAVEFDRGDGSYTFELVVNVGPDEPEIALLWSTMVGTTAKSPPPVDVLFPDQGHPDRALTRRAEALVSRLRTTQLLDTMKISPTLSQVASSRADAIAGVGAVGHKIPSGRSAFADLQRANPKFGVARLGEVQAQAGTLDEAWRALLQSPAHRYELVEPLNTHMGVSVRRSNDAAGRSLVSLVVLVAKRTSERSRIELATELIGRFNLARHSSGGRPLVVDARLSTLALHHAQAMAAEGALNEMATSASGEVLPIAALAQAQLKDVDDVRAVFARLSDPLRLAPSSATLAPEMRTIGVGLWPQGIDGQWYVCVLVAEPTGR